MQQVRLHHFIARRLFLNMPFPVAVHPHAVTPFFSAAVEVAFVRAGDECLHPLDFAQQPRAPRHVEFAHHVVEQQNRRLPSFCAERLQLCQLNCQRRRTDLPLRREHLHASPHQRQPDVLAVNTAARAANANVLLPAFFQLRPNRRHGIARFRHARLIGHSEHFVRSSADSLILLRRDFRQLLH